MSLRATIESIHGAGAPGVAALGVAALVVGGTLAGAGVAGAGLAAGLAAEGMTRFGFCLSGSTNGPFWPHASSMADKLTTVNSRMPFMTGSIPAAVPAFARNF
jgi:hypothetical protein